uniref:Sec-independent protein translocase component tatA n=1 Tax=Chattonella marina var. antiqua TaxID=859642 RepID=E5RSB7_CHAMQ|nr:hypothetical protein [Chattonella marina var. antiqua]BAJ51983.1 hypothetical protein [Chattonella marina var. antiqua]
MRLGFGQLLIILLLGCLLFGDFQKILKKLQFFLNFVKKKIKNLNADEKKVPKVK